MSETLEQGSSGHKSLSSQVGGHPGVQSSEDGSLIFKPCLSAERDFYQLLVSGDERFSKLFNWTPKFYGTLRLEGKVKDDGDVVGSAESTVGSGGKRTAEDVVVSVQKTLEPAPESIVLENISHPFSKPCILDIKLGTVLYDHTASEDKKERMIKAARETTSLETGVRLTGFMVHDHTTQQPAITPKAYGKSIKPSDLPDGMLRFFPVASKTEAGSPAGQGLSRDLLVPVLEGLLEEVKTLREAVAGTEMRMVGGSILVVYEAEWEKAKAGLERLTKSVEMVVEDDDEDDEYDDVIRTPYCVRMIDFAHTRHVPGEGPDEGVLLGLDTTIRLFEGRIKQLREIDA